MGERLLDQRIDGDVVLYVAVVVEDAVLAVSGERIEGDVGDDAQLREARTQRARGTLGNTVRIPGFGGIQDFFSSGVTGNSASAGMPSATSSSASSSSRSMDSRSTPGIDGTASRRFSPSSTNTGRIRSSTVSTFSRTRRRENSSRRLRRRRVAGNRRLAGTKLTTDSWPAKRANMTFYRPGA